MKVPVIIAAVLIAAALFLVVSPGDGRPEDAGNTPEGRRARVVKKVFRAIGLLLALYVLLGLLMYVLRDRFIYHPERRIPQEAERPDEVQDCHFTTEDGLQLHGWWRPAGDAEDAPVVLWFHGNAGDISRRVDNLQMMPDSLNVFLIDYRGFGRSEGHPSEEGLYEDARAAHRYLVEERDIAPERIVVFGRSLGAAVALQLGLERPVGAVIMESPFRSVAAMAQAMFPFLPAGFMVGDMYDNVSKVKDLDVPLLVIHGTEDDLVPFGHGRAVYEAAGASAELYPIDGAGHNDTYQVGGSAYFERLLNFCREHSEEEAPTARQNTGD